MTEKTRLTAAEFLRRLKAKASAAERKKYERYFPDSKEFIGVRMGAVFALAKEFIEMPVGEIEKLMESEIHEARAGAMSIMGKSAASKKAIPERLKELYELYIRRHDRINSWEPSRPGGVPRGGALPGGQTAQAAIQAGEVEEMV